MLTQEAVFVYEIQDRVVGFISGMTRNAKIDSEVNGLYISPEQKGNGIGTSLLSYMKKFFISSGCERFISCTLLGARNNQFYKANGGVGLEKKKLSIGATEYQGILRIC